MEYIENDFPLVRSEVYLTRNGTRYLKTPGMTILNKPDVNISGLFDYLNGFPEELNFPEYLEDPVKLTDAETLTKTAGQWCYGAFDENRTWNKDADRYFGNIKDQKHGSIMEHASFTFAIWGISRSFTHEIVRHRAGCAFSQVSQRYVGEKSLRFVERPEFVVDPVLHKRFLRKIDRFRNEYVWLNDYLVKKQESGEEILSAERKTDLKKKVRQCSRAELPNETEAPIIVTANVRAWRNILEQRVSSHAEVEIRRIVFNVFLCLKPFLPNILDDYKTVELVDGTVALASPYSKV